MADAARLTAEDAVALRDCLTGGGVAVIPTDTVYGLACNPLSGSAVRRLYELKGRLQDKPSAVMFFALAPALDALDELGPRTRAALTALLPGPLTLILPNPERRYPLACDPQGGAGGALGLRVPVLDGPAKALRDLDMPVMQSSANLSGGSDPRSLDAVPQRLREGADLALDGGELPGTASTVVDLTDYEQTGEWRIVRDGPLDRASIARKLLLAS